MRGPGRLGNAPAPLGPGAAAAPSTASSRQHADAAHDPARAPHAEALRDGRFHPAAAALRSRGPAGCQGGATIMHDDGDHDGHPCDPPGEAGGAAAAGRWRYDGVRVIPGDRLDSDTAQTPGMVRQAAIDHARVGAQKIWAGTVAIAPDAKTGIHHHGALESVIYIVSGRARMRWGDRLEYVAEAGPGDFIFVPPYVPHQEINADPHAPLQCVLVRSGNEAVVVAITDVEPVERPQTVHWVDPIHKHP